MEKKGKKLKLKIEALNVINDVEKEKIVGGATGNICGYTRLNFTCELPWSISACTHREASGCPQCP